MTTTTKWIIGIVILAAIIAAIMIVQGKKANAQSTSTTGEVQSIVNNSIFPLKNGVMNNTNVEALQRHLNSKGANLQIDGDFGVLTESALLKYYNTKEFTKAQFDQHVK